MLVYGAERRGREHFQQHRPCTLVNGEMAKDSRDTGGRRHTIIGSSVGKCEIVAVPYPCTNRNYPPVHGMCHCSLSHLHLYEKNRQEHTPSAHTHTYIQQQQVCARKSCQSFIQQEENCFFLFLQVYHCTLVEEVSHI